MKNRMTVELKVDLQMSERMAAAIEWLKRLDAANAMALRRQDLERLKAFLRRERTHRLNIGMVYCYQKGIGVVTEFERVKPRGWVAPLP